MVSSSRMLRSKVWPSSVRRSLISRTRSRIASSRSTPARRKSRSAKLRTRSASSSSPEIALLGVVDHDQVVDLAVEREVGQQLVGLDLRRLGLLADRGVGVHLLDQAAGREGVAEGQRDVVPALEQLGGARGRSAFSAATSSRAASSWSVVRVVSQADQASVPASAAGMVSGARSVTPATLPADAESSYADSA